MEHEIDLTAVTIVAACFVIWGLLSAKLQRFNITAPVAFVALGLLVANGPLSLVDIGLHAASVRHVAEITLALVLFADASRVNVGALRHDVAVPARLLGLGLPLTIGAGFAAALLVTHGNLWLAALIGAAVAPTDAALGAGIMRDERVPGRVRRILNVESGLNDGIATPFVTFFIAGAAAENLTSAPSLGDAVIDIAVGVGLGVAIGLAGGLLFHLAAGRGWSSASFLPLAVLGLALGSYTATVGAGGNAFVAAFLAGMAFGSVTSHRDAPILEFTDDAGELLSLVVWFLFGATMIAPAFEHLEWVDVVFAIMALTIVRMVPVAIALARSGLDRSTVAFVGWFGPRGLASVVFALIAVDSLEPVDGNRVLAAVSCTILLSVVASRAQFVAARRSVRGPQSRSSIRASPNTIPRRSCGPDRSTGCPRRSHEGETR